ncbi:MAG: ester cyclase [Candidatus Latescibacteria bacterium]|nr:ester cyclase [Candidatus Latescibacterota bacterium]
MSTEENKAVIRRIVEEVWNNWSLKAAHELYAKDYIDHIRPPGEPQGMAGLEKIFHEWRAAFPDWTITIDSMIAEGDLVAAHLTGRGTHKGVYMGIAPTGKQIVGAGIEIFRIAGGQVVEFWASVDELGMFRQMGMIPLK